MTGTMVPLPRRRPGPLPAVRPVPEYLAGARVKQRYEDMKAVFQVPWMGVATMAYAQNPTFYGTFWDGLRPLFASRPFVDACQDPRAETDPRQATAADDEARFRAAVGQAPRRSHTMATRSSREFSPNRLVVGALCRRIDAAIANPGRRRPRGRSSSRCARPPPPRVRADR